MGMLDGLLGGIVGAGMVSVVNGIIEKHGGLQGVVSEFERNGLGATVKSWVGTGPNQPISPDEVHKALGPDLLQQLSAKSGCPCRNCTEAIAGVAASCRSPDAERRDPEGLRVKTWSAFRHAQPWPHTQQTPSPPGPKITRFTAAFPGITTIRSRSQSTTLPPTATSAPSASSTYPSGNSTIRTMSGAC